MAEQRLGLWRYRALFLVLAASVLFVQLLPLNPGPGRWPGPDLLLLITLSWTVMRPELVSVPVVAGVFLIADLLLMQPPGLWTALVILGCEFLRSRRYLLRNAPFPVEWLLVAGIVAVLFVLNAVILSLFGVPQPSLGLTVIRIVLTILVYPVVVLIAARMFGLRPAFAEQDSLGAWR
ncbi:MAG: rod shape-determining protein MreD [Paracoccaceae bacterium]|nr:rod shape-determining protein MreD [Paracoccaceae bacterium]